MNTDTMKSNTFSSQTEGFSPRQAALIAGWSLIGIALAAGFAYGYVFNQLILPDNSLATFENIVGAASLFRAGVGVWLIILILDVLAAWALYLFLKPGHSGISLLAAWLRLGYVSLLGTALLNFIPVMELTSGAEYLSAFAPEQLHAQVQLALNAFSGMWSLALIVFGLHLWALGWAVFNKRGIHKIWGYLLLLAGTCYLIVHGMQLLFPSLDALKSTLESILALPMTIGELGFAIWLIFKGGKAA